MLALPNLARVVLAAPVALTLALTQTGCPDDPHSAATWTEKLGSKTELERALTELQRIKDPESIDELAKAWEDNNKPARILRIIISIADQYDPEDERFSNISAAAARKLDPNDKKYDAQKEITDPVERKKIAEARYKADVKRTYGPFHKKGPFWDKAIPVLHKSVTEYLGDDNNDRLIENAIAAVDALGKAKEFGTDSDVQIIIDAAKHSVPADSKAQVVRVAALRALGKWPDSDAAKTTLIDVLKLAGEEEQHPAVFAAAADALGYAKSADAIDPLIKAMFNLPAVYGFCRRSLVAIGQPAIKPLTDVFTRKHKDMVAFAKEKKFFAKCEGFRKIGKQRVKVDLGGTKSCIAPKALEVKAANILGDLQARQAVPAMLKELDRKPQPSGWHPQSGAPFTNQHQAIFVALRKMGANKKVANRLISYIKDKESEDNLVAMAIDTYSFVTRDTGQLEYFKTIMLQTKSRTGEKLDAKDKDPSDPMSVAASIAYSRLASKKADMAPFKAMIATHTKEAKDFEKRFEAANKTFQALDKPCNVKKKDADADWVKCSPTKENKKKKPSYKQLDAKYKAKLVRPAIKAWDDANAELKKNDPAAHQKARGEKPWFAEIKKKHKKKYDQYKKAKKIYDEAERKKLNLENKMNQAIGLQRAAQQNMARIVVGVQCKGDPKCLVSFGSKKPKEVAEALDKNIKGAAKWPPDQQKLLWIAANERALLDLAKLGKKASPVTDDLLALLPSTERFIREGVLLALPQVAELPCQKCVTTLDTVIKEQENQTPLAALTADARVWRNFYRWAGTKQ